MFPVYKIKFQRRIDRVSWIQGYTNTGAALERVRTKLFAEGGRENVPKVIVVVTDGESTDTEKLMSEAATLKDQFYLQRTRDHSIMIHHVIKD